MINRVHLVGGPPGAGKTTLGLALGRRLDAQSLTIDDIRTALLATTTPATHPALHVISLPDPWSYFTQTSPTEMVEHAVAQHTALWPAVERVIRKRLSSGQDVVIDGWHLMPELVAGADLPRVGAVWLDVSPEVLQERERSVWDFYAKSEDPERMFDNFIRRSLAWNDRMRDEARRFGYQVVHQDGSKSVEALVQEVLSR